MSGHDTKSPGGGLFQTAAEGLRGTVTVPGDKSISHRAVLLGAVSSGPVTIEGFLRSDDTLASVRAVRSLGVAVDYDGDELVVQGSGWAGLQEPDDVIDVMNSGTLMRLLPGLVAGRDILCVLTGDSSIRRRPMARVLSPLSSMGVAVAGRASNTLPPISVRGGSIRGADHVLPVASAQVKSCLLLAGLRAKGPTSIKEPALSRDHTERMLIQGGCKVERDGLPEGPGVVRVWPVDELCLSRVRVPGDFSSAAFLLVAALITPDSEVTVDGVGLNPTRIGLVHALQRMGAEIALEVTDSGTQEPVGSITARYSELSATEVSGLEVPTLIDELPALMLAAAKAHGVSVISGAAELRVKESDRLSAMTRLLSDLGIRVHEREDGLKIEGDPSGWSGGSVVTEGDHRLAMAGAIAGCASREGVRVDDVGCIAVSFPEFVRTLCGMGARWQPVD